MDVTKYRQAEQQLFEDAHISPEELWIDLRRLRAGSSPLSRRR